MGDRVKPIYTMPSQPADFHLSIRKEGVRYACDWVNYLLSHFSQLSSQLFAGDEIEFTVPGTNRKMKMRPTRGRIVIDWMRIHKARIQDPSKAPNDRGFFYAMMHTDPELADLEGARAGVPGFLDKKVDPTIKAIKTLEDYEKFVKASGPVSQQAYVDALVKEFDERIRPFLGAAEIHAQFTPTALATARMIQIIRDKYNGWVIPYECSPPAMDIKIGTLNLSRLSFTLRFTPDEEVITDVAFDRDGSILITANVPTLIAQSDFDAGWLGKGVMTASVKGAKAKITIVPHPRPLEGGGGIAYGTIAPYVHVSLDRSVNVSFTEKDGDPATILNAGAKIYATDAICAQIAGAIGSALFDGGFTCPLSPSTVGLGYSDVNADLTENNYIWLSNSLGNNSRSSVPCPHEKYENIDLWANVGCEERTPKPVLVPTASFRDKFLARSNASRDAFTISTQQHVCTTGISLNYLSIMAHHEYSTHRKWSGDVAANEILSFAPSDPLGKFLRKFNGGKEARCQVSGIPTVKAVASGPYGLEFTADFAFTTKIGSSRYTLNVTARIPATLSYLNLDRGELDLAGPNPPQFMFDLARLEVLKPITLNRFFGLSIFDILKAREMAAALDADGWKPFLTQALRQALRRFSDSRLTRNDSGVQVFHGVFGLTVDVDPTIPAVFTTCDIAVPLLPPIATMWDYGVREGVGYRI